MKKLVLVHSILIIIFSTCANHSNNLEQIKNKNKNKIIKDKDKNKIIKNKVKSLLKGTHSYLQSKSKSTNSIIKSKKKKKIFQLAPDIAAQSPFIENAKKYGLENTSAVAIYAVDFNNDLKTDLVILPEYYSVPIFYQNIKGKYVALDYNPFKILQRASFLIFNDFDKDGVLDVLVATFNQKTSLNQEPIKIYQGLLKNKKISYHYKGSPLSDNTYPVSSIALLDYDLDGKIDLFLGNWFAVKNVGKKRTPNRIYKGMGKFTFKDATYLLPKEIDYSKEYNDYLNAGPTMGVSICDIDQNGYPDILTANSSGYKNRLWINQIDHKHNDRIFNDYSLLSGYGCDDNGKFDPLNGGNTFFSLCGDYNNDGIIDIAVGEIYHAYDSEQKDRSSILTGSTFNFPPKFLRSEYYKDDGSGNWSEGDRRGVWIDYNSDGLKDLVIDNAGFPPTSRLIFFEQTKDHSFVDLAKKYGINLLNPSGTITLDINNDGRIDLLSGQTSLRLGDFKNQKTKLYIFENKYNWKGNRSIRIFLRGKNSNRFAIGASLYLKTSKGIFSNFVQYNFGTSSSQLEEGTWFGIQKNSKIKKIEVRWPYRYKGQLNSKTYDLSSFNFKYHVDITLCEDGRIKSGRKRCY